MKKVLALALALIMALSCCAIAFAEDGINKCGFCGTQFASEEALEQHLSAGCPKAPVTTEAKMTCSVCGAIFSESERDKYIEHVKTHTNPEGPYTCPTCGKMYSNLYEYNACVGSHFNNVNYHYDKYIAETIPDLLGHLIDLFNNTGILETIKNLVAKIWELIQNFASETQVAGAVSDLESKIGTLNLTGDLAENVKNIIKDLKQKIKDFYAGDKATVVETVAEAPAETGSASIGIAAFAAVSVAAAAAYVCTKKRA